MDLTPAPAVDPVDFRSLMATFPTGVGIVTSMEPDGRPWGLTCSSICSVTLRPPTLLVCLRESSPTLAAMLRLSTFAVNLLHSQAEPAADLFSSGRPNRFDLVRWTAQPSFGGPHLDEDAHTIADCRITRTTPVSDHAVVFGEVFGVHKLVASAPSPLMYSMRRYHSLDIADNVDIRQ